MKIFISGPIRKYAHCGYNREAFMLCEKYYLERGHAIMNPIRLHTRYPERLSHEDYMRVCFAMLDVCDVIALLPGWQDSEGARQEYERAYLLKKTIIRVGITADDRRLSEL